MSGSSFIPVAADGITTFNGIVDGNNKTITNLVINLADNSYVGLFGRVGAEGQISNLTIGEGSAVNGKQYVGAFAGSMDGYLTKLQELRQRFCYKRQCRGIRRHRLPERNIKRPHE